MASAADLDAEREVDLRSYLSALATRWWLLAAGLVGGIIVGLLISLGGNQVWTAKTTVYLGQPLSPTGSAPRHVQVAANTLARIVIGITSRYADKLIASWQAQVSPYNQSLKTIDEQVAKGGLSATDKLIVAIQRAQIADQLTTAKQQLAVAQEVELGQQKTFAVASKTTAKSRRNTVIVAALLGLLLGIFAALLWDPVARVVRRPS